MQKKVYVPPVLATLCLLAAACDQQGGNRGTSETAAQSESLPLEKRVFHKYTHEEGDTRVEYLDAAFGNWMARCQYGYNVKLHVRDKADCLILPWRGRFVRGRPVPLRNGVTVELFNYREPQLRFGPGTRAPGSPYELACGYTRVKGKGNKTYLNGDEAAPFLYAMTQSDCELTFTQSGAASPTILKMPRRGFTEALDYGKEYVRSRR